MPSLSPTGLRPRRRVRRPGMIRLSLLIVAAVVVLPILFLGGRLVVGERVRAQQIVELLTELDSERAEAFRATGGGAAYMDRVEQSTASTIERIKEIATGNGPMDIVGQTLIAHHEATRADEQRYGELVREAERTMSFDGSNARSARELDQRIGAVEEMITLTTRLRDAQNGFPNKLRDELQKTNASSERISSIMSEFTRGFSSAPAIEAMRLEIRILELGRDNLALLRDSWGRWTVQGDSVIFSRDRDLERFNAIQSEMMRVIDQQARMLGGG
jgi:hypothetical protein